MFVLCLVIDTSAKRLSFANGEIFVPDPKKKESFLIQRNVSSLQSYVLPALLTTRNRLKLAG